MTLAQEIEFCSFVNKGPLRRQFTSRHSRTRRRCNKHLDIESARHSGQREETGATVTNFGLPSLISWNRSQVGPLIVYHLTPPGTPKIASGPRDTTHFDAAPSFGAVEAFFTNLTLVAALELLCVTLL